jgi:hypothetical protein
MLLPGPLPLLSVSHSFYRHRGKDELETATVIKNSD